MCKTEEIWKDIEGYEGYYQVSNMGNIKSLDRTIVCKKKLGSIQRFIKGKMMTTSKGKDGYAYVHLTKEHIGKYYKVHRLVAEAFIPNPNNLPCVNHKDEDRFNNLVDNLEWCSYAYNNNYGNRLDKISQALTGITRSEETKKKISEARKGKHLSEETKAKLSEINKGENNPNYGLHRTEETKEKLRQALKGRMVSKETKQKLREAALKQWEYQKKIMS